MRRTRSRALRAASRARAASTAFWMTRFATPGFSSRKVPRRSLMIASTMPFTSVLPSFVLVCPSNCGRGIFTLMTAVRPSRMSSPLMLASFRSFAQRVLRRVGVDRARERRAEPGQVRAALGRVDVVGERVHELRVAVVPLQRDLGVDALALASHVDDVLVHLHLVRVEEGHELADAAAVEVLGALAFASFVLEDDVDAGVEEGELAQPLRERVVAELAGLEDLAVRLERDLGAAPLGRAGDLELGRRLRRARTSAGRPGRSARSRA